MCGGCARGRTSDKGGRQDQYNNEGGSCQGRRRWARAGASEDFTREEGGGCEAEKAFSLSQYEEAGGSDGFQRGNTRPAAPLQALRYTPEGHMSQCEEGGCDRGCLGGTPCPCGPGLWNLGEFQQSREVRGRDPEAEVPVLEDSRGGGSGGISLEASRRDAKCSVIKRLGFACRAQ